MVDVDVDAGESAAFISEEEVVKSVVAIHSQESEDKRISLVRWASVDDFEIRLN